MCDLFFGLLELNTDLIEERSHSFLPVEHISSLFVAFNVVFYFLLEILVHSFVVQNAQKAFIDLIVQHFVFIGKIKVLFSEVFSLNS